MKKIAKKLGVALAFIPMLALAVGGFGVMPASAVAQNSNTATCDSFSGVASGVSCGKNNSSPTNLFGNGGIFQTVINIMLFIVGVLAVIMIIYAGIRYTSSRGASGEITSAKNTLMYSIIGLVIAIFAYAIVNWVVFAATNTTAS